MSKSWRQWAASEAPQPAAACHSREIGALARWAYGTASGALRDAPAWGAVTLTMDACKTATFPGQFASLAAIAAFIAPAAEAAGFDARAVYSVTMAVDEACTNIIEHAYKGEGRGPIECTYQIRQDRLTVILRDFGTPFDPAAVPPPDLDSDLQARDVGGLGVHFMRSLMDCVTFEFTPDSGNVLTMTKFREKPL